MKKNIRFLPAFLLLNCLSAQLENSHWYMGLGSSIVFGNDALSFNVANSMATIEATTSAADACGNLLFYSNGGVAPAGLDEAIDNEGAIWNRNHEVMYDMGSIEGGGGSATQGALTFPVPGSTDRHYLFTLDDFDNENGVLDPTPIFSFNNGFAITVAFSLDGRYLFTDDIDPGIFVPIEDISILRYDLEAADIQASAPVPLVVAAGVYAFTLTDANGCVTNDQIALIDQEPLTANVETLQFDGCDESAAAITIESISGGSAYGPLPRPAKSNGSLPVQPLGEGAAQRQEVKPRLKTNALKLGPLNASTNLS